MNPIIPHVFAADPAARVWPGDPRIWLYTSHDEPDTNTHDSMRSYHAFSSYDLVNWTDYGVVLHLDEVPWASSHMWAIDCIHWNQLYTLIYCAVEQATGMFRTGLAVCERPEGPFRDVGFIRNVEHGQDPAVLIEDGVPYLFWGSGKSMHGCQLTQDLTSSVPGTYVNLSAELTWAFEGPWLHKYGGKFYLTYPGLFEGCWPESMYYATADRPLGPYVFRGEYIPRYTGQAGTNHGSVVEWGGQWLAFHHSMWLSNESTRRSVMCDALHFTDGGEILPITPSFDGVTGQPSQVTIWLNADTGDMSMGKLVGVRVETERPGFGGAGYIAGFDQTYWGFTVVAQVAHPCDARLVLRYQAPHGVPEHLAVMVNGTKLSGNLPDASHDNWVSRFVLPETCEWREVDLGEVSLRPGNNSIRVYRGPECTAGALIDAVILRLTSISPSYVHA